MTVRDKLPIMQMLRVMPQFNEIDMAVAEEVIDSHLGNPDKSDYFVSVAEFDSAVVGYVCYGPTPLTEGTWDVYWLAVSPQNQGYSLGKTLLGFAEDDIRKAQGRLILIETSSKPEYDKARGFYASRGYEIACRIADFYSPGDDLVTFLKRLR